MLLILILSCFTSLSLALYPQYVFAHRVNDIDIIKYPLEAGSNGIEIDICESSGDWYVSHNDLGCKVPTAPRLSEWLLTLKTLLLNEKYSTQLAMLWLDIKTPYSDKMKTLPALIHDAGLPIQLKILYDLTAFNDNSKTGFQHIYQLLNNNEGISFCAGKSCGGSITSVGDIYNYYSNYKFKRGTFNHGDSVDINDDYLIKANEYNKPDDYYRFKLILTWTNALESSMVDYVNPNASQYTDGQIVGSFIRHWVEDDKGDIDDFKNAISKYPNLVRLATPKDDPFNYFVRPRNFNGYCDCDCNYSFKSALPPSGGCKISALPPSGTACKCIYKELPPWTCVVEVTKCAQQSSQYCVSPNYNKNSCVQGGGDCEGY